MITPLPPLPTSIRKAWVSGASSGLGCAFAEALLARGVEVWGTSRRAERLEQWRGEPRFHPVLLDLHDREAALLAYLTAEGEADGFDLVIHNAGFGVFGRFAATPLEAWMQQLEAMVLTIVALNRVSFASMMARNRGTLVNVSSLAVSFPLPFMSSYNVSKAALSALSESLLFEARGSEVVVIDFRPGDFRTAFNEAAQRVREPAGTLPDPRVERAWRSLETHLKQAPLPERAVRDLWRALCRGRPGIVTSGSFFQAKLGVWWAKFAPARLRRAVALRYFGVA